MPNAHEYRDAARRLHDLSAQLSAEWALVRAATEPTSLAGGPVRIALENTRFAVGGSLHRAGEELERLARVCARRAEICAGYEADLRRHEQRRSVLDRWTVPPTPPARWVER